jgi:transposase
MLSRPVLHAEETPVAMLKPGHGMTHRAYLCSYGTTVSVLRPGDEWRLARDTGLQRLRGVQGAAITACIAGPHSLVTSVPTSGSGDTLTRDVVHQR